MDFWSTSVDPIPGSLTSMDPESLTALGPGSCWRSLEPVIVDSMGYPVTCFYCVTIPKCFFFIKFYIFINKYMKCYAPKIQKWKKYQKLSKEDITHRIRLSFIQIDFSSF